MCAESVPLLDGKASHAPLHVGTRDAPDGTQEMIVRIRFTATVRFVLPGHSRLITDKMTVSREVDATRGGKHIPNGFEGMPLRL
ncbi:unnamed protein product [Gemmata massiliana]|uniref:Uncharacterized protein n=1 Tax=Gemmata massiliana TaxID=1210884 RepID=A0A6P2CU13_9BACT|nr:unnamed protein product [Gemmata massiliana]